MKTTAKRKYLKRALAGLLSIAVVFGLTTNSVLAVEISDEDNATLQAVKKKEADKQLPADEQPAPDHPATPSGKSAAANLAEAATNPVAAMIQFQMQNSYSWKNHNSSSYSNVTTIQPVIPIPLKSKKVPVIITRTTVPYITTPKLGGIGHVRGVGDINFLMLATPKLKTEGVQIGLGFNSVLPTAGDNVITGSGKYQLGPSALYINMQTPGLQWGLFAYQLWDVANGSNGSSRPGVSKLSLQPFITKHFKGGWYMGSSDTPQTYNFKSDKWTLALGWQVGRVMKLGKKPVKLFAEILNDPKDNNGATSEWTLKLNITFLIPEK